MLKKGGYVDSKRGVSGGYYLAKAPNQIILGQVLRFLEGPLEPLMCVGKKDYTECKDFTSCLFRDIWSQVYTATSLVVDTVTFAELVRRYRAKKIEGQAYNYNI